MHQQTTDAAPVCNSDYCSDHLTDTRDLGDLFNVIVRVMTVVL